MQRNEFIQQCWLDYIHSHPDLGALTLTPRAEDAEYMTLMTLNADQFSARAISPALDSMGYQLVARYAMADKGLLIHLWSPQNSGCWLIIAELQLGTLPKRPREALTRLIHEGAPPANNVELFCHGRPWPMPSWALHEKLLETHPLAAWLATMGPRLHHAGFNCQVLGQPLQAIDQQLGECGMARACAEQNGIFPVSSLLEHRFYPANAQKMVFADGDEHRVAFGGLALVQKRLEDNNDPIACQLLPYHTRCEVV